MSATAPTAGRNGMPRLSLSGSSAATGQWLQHVLPLLVLVGLELAAMAHLRRYFRRHHGG